MRRTKRLLICALALLSLSAPAAVAQDNPKHETEDYARAEADTKLRYLPGFVGGKEGENFTGRLRGVVSTYEYTSGGKPMAGRVYYLQADGRTLYVLHFTGARDKLQRIQNQTDAIARSFRLKQ